MTTSRFKLIHLLIMLMVSASFPMSLKADTQSCDILSETEIKISDEFISGTPFSESVTAPVKIVVDQLPELSIKSKPLDCSIYSLPYSPTLSVPDWRRLWINTAALGIGGGTALIVLNALPQNSTAWSRVEEKETPMGKRWVEHVKEGPVWDHDKFIFNYVLHPYAGAAYYMSARSCGFNIWGSVLYSFCISTFFWEYGVEAFMEIPSVEDLVITPVVGALFGEGFYKIKRSIVDRDYRVLGSKAVGRVIAFIIDPVNECLDYIVPNKRMRARMNGISYRPTNRGFEFGLTYAF